MLKKVTNIDHIYEWGHKYFLPGLYDKLEPKFLYSASSLRLSHPMIVQTRKKSKLERVLLSMFQ